MKAKKVLILFHIVVAVLSFTIQAFCEDSGLVSSGAVIKTVQSGFQGTEGPATDADGNVYFSDMMQQRIYRWTWKDGNVTVYRENTGMGNGTMFDPEGNLIVCEMANNRVTLDDMKGNIRIIADSIEGKTLANPNDVWVAPNGGIYFSVFSMGGGPGAGSGGTPGRAPSGLPSGGQGDSTMPGSVPGADTQGRMPIGASGGNMPVSAPGGGTQGAMPGGTSSSDERGEIGIFYISPDGNKVIQVTTDIAGPNGLIGTPDGKTLYIGDNSANKIWSYRINPDGTLSGKRLFCESETDGMAMDEKNNVYLTTRQTILIYSPAGELLETIATPEGCSNIEFCGKDRKTLFITYHGSIYTLEMAVKGAPTALDMAGGNK